MLRIAMSSGATQSACVLIYNASFTILLMCNRLYVIRIPTPSVTTKVI